MILRSLLFVPGDDAAKIAKAMLSGADALILDLEDSVSAARKEVGRSAVAEALCGRPTGARPHLFVRINPISSPQSAADLGAIMPGAPDGIVLPKAEGGCDVVALAHRLEVLEQDNGLASQTMILPIATETPRALFRLDSYTQLPRLCGLTWGAEDLPAAVGASINRLPNGTFTDLCRLARALCLAGAAEAEVPAFETVFTDFRDLDGLRAYAGIARQEGFAGMMAIHPGQIEIINAAFTPTPAEIDRAKQIVGLFAEGAGVASLDGQMLDLPHLKQAQRLLKGATPTTARTTRD